MSGEATGYDILDKYRGISAKLKKRFLRKPNVSEACESFVSLGQQCEAQEMPSYAGLTWMAAARCEGSLGNNATETSYLIRSGRQFLSAEESDWNLGCVSVPSDNLQAGLSCFTHASTRCPESSAIPVGLELETVDFLKRIGREEFLEPYLLSAVELSEERPLAKLHSLDLLASYFISEGDHVPALETYMELTQILSKIPDSGFRAEMLLKCEINSIFLLLILRPTPQKLSPLQGKLLEKYTWGDKNHETITACHMGEKLFLLIQSLVVICQSFDTNGLLDLEGQFWPYISAEQKDLLRVLVQTHHA